MICEKCGREFDDELQFCPECDKEEDEIEELEIPEEDDIAEEKNETEEYSEDELELIEEDDDEYDDEEDFEVDLYDDSKKLPKAFKIVAIIVAALILIAAGAGIFYGAIRPDIDSPIASWFDDGKKIKPVVYTKNNNGTYGLYVGETQLANFGTTSRTYTLYNDFICSEDNVYYIVDGSLYWYNVHGKAPAKVLDNANTASIVMSANGNRILFTATENNETTLYSYIKGKSAKKVEVLPCAVDAFDLPQYGFVGDTSEYWYIVADRAVDNGKLYVSSFFGGAKLKYDNIGSVVYYSSDYDAFIYTYNAGLKIKLYAKIGNNEPVLMKADFNGAFEPIIIKAPGEGVAYVGEDGGNANTLYFLPFDGSGSRVIDKNVIAAVSVWDALNPEQGRYEQGAFVKKTDALYYMKSMDIMISRGANPGQMPTDFNFYNSKPEHSDDSNTIAYLSNDTTLMVATYNGNSWNEAAKVSENVSQYKLSRDGKYLAYLASNGTSSSANLYNVSTGQNQQLTDNAVGDIMFDVNYPDTVIFAKDLDATTLTATVNYYEDGKTVTPVESGIAGYSQAPGGKILFIKLNAANPKLLDLYTLGKGYKLVPEASSLSAINAY